jgi:hypothetical protein
MSIVLGESGSQGLSDLEAASLEAGPTGLQLDERDPDLPELRSESRGLSLAIAGVGW